MLFSLHGKAKAQSVVQNRHQVKTISFEAFIDQLQDGEQYDIEMMHAGCFNQSSETLSILRTGNTYTALLNSVERNLNDGHIATLRTFESELRNVKGGVCTTTETYVLRYKSERLQYSDASCTYWFAKHLKENLGFSY